MKFYLDKWITLLTMSFRPVNWQHDSWVSWVTFPRDSPRLLFSASGTRSGPCPGLGRSRMPTFWEAGHCWTRRWLPLGLIGIPESFFDNITGLRLGEGWDTFLSSPCRWVGASVWLDQLLCAQGVTVCGFFFFFFVGNVKSRFDFMIVFFVYF